jgi:hypothetical protein
MEEPLKCPICGHEAVLHNCSMLEDHGRGYDAESYWYQCNHCDMIKANGANTIYCSDEKARSLAVENWNKEVKRVIALMLDNPAISYKCK